MPVRLRLLALLPAASMLTACGTTIYSLKVPLAEPPSGPTAVSVLVPSVDIRDQRPAAERVVHTGGGLLRCERWYGDDNFEPPKPVYLQQLLAAHAKTPLRVELERFDTIEYCQNTSNAGASAAAAGASGGVYIPPAKIPMGDSLRIRLKGEVDGVPFDVQRQFDYSDLTWRFAELPASNPQYRARLRTALAELAAEIAALAPPR